MSKIDKAMREANILIKKAKSHEELNQIAFKYWGTKKSPIKGINRVMAIEYLVKIRRIELEAGMDNK